MYRFYFILSIFLSLSVKSQSFSRIAFYNVENFFDTFDDSATRDDEFTPEGERHWTKRKFEDKRNKIYKTIIAMGEYNNPPPVIGLIEIENDYVLRQLTEKTPLSRFGYRIIHKNSPDRRGIDVGMLYQPDKVEVIRYEYITVKKPDDESFRTRDILYVTMKIANDTLHYFVNHWPSRYSGAARTKPLRNLAARTVLDKVQQIQSQKPDAKIAIMGDFNDYPTDESLSQVLNAQLELDMNLPNSSLYNISYIYLKKNKVGTHKYQGVWGILDQIIVSKSLLTKSGNGFFVTKDSPNIFSADFLLEDDRNGGKTTNRTYIGYRYHEGFSDHLPIYLDLFYDE